MRIGIDLGTTNSLVAAFKDGAPVLIPNALGEVLTPSAVSLGEDGTLFVGRAALDRQLTHPQATATTFKRHMGTAHRRKLGKREFAPEELSALVLQSLKRDAEAFLGTEVTGAVVTVPAYFNDRQRKATRRAGELAGLPIDRLINEPTAAALAFGISDRDDHEPFLVFDLGGGTFDVSIVEIFDGIIEVRASAGDNRLGGEDFNEALIGLAEPRLGIERQRHDAELLRTRLLAAAETCRRQLTDADSGEFALTIGEERLATTVATDEFEAQVAGLVARLREPVLRALRDSRIRADELSDVVLVGGATRMPVVRKAITRLFGRFPNHRVHPDEAVALGAAVQVGLMDRDIHLDEVRMTDICPFTLGVEAGSYDPRGVFITGQFSPIIERNTPIPASREQTYLTVQDKQREIAIEVYQGESRLVSDNVKLGCLTLKVPPRPAGEVVVNVRFSYDLSGLLEVDTFIPATGERANLTIADDEGGMPQAELEKRKAALAALKIHPREDAMNVALLARAERAYEDHLGPQREHLSGMINHFRAVIESQDPRAIDEARKQFSAALDQLEAERFL
ncbi:Hsp70 family protein [Sphingomonas sp. LHG3406-1]|uniref:Hsp70 family protein n=1 Tax=Sphingomonas sp. LHG3406-1 TaxID=2804617 RepID=UPI0026287198|nr:molecular chaperone HscC [Sphingomonas sp. LHG3406-1]